MAETSIEWAHRSWNPTRGCRRVSAGCGGSGRQGGCYAERQAYRFSGKGQPYEGLVTLTKKGPRWTGRGRFVFDKLYEPFSWRAKAGERLRIFTDSMSDLFFEAFSFEEISSVLGVMAACPQHDFLVLTKRPQRALEFFQWLDHQTGGPRTHVCWEALRSEALHHPKGDGGPLHTKLCADPGGPWPLPNLWLGVSVENQPTADERIPLLLQCPAAVRFVSYEPALGPVDFQHLQPSDPPTEINALEGTHGVIRPHRGQCVRLDWVIVGGESGPGARPFDLWWGLDVIRQCQKSDTQVFFKQAGAKPYLSRLPEWHEFGGGSWSADIVANDGRWNVKLKNRKGSDLSELPPSLRVRELPEARS